MSAFILMARSYQCAAITLHPLVCCNWIHQDWYPKVSSPHICIAVHCTRGNATGVIIRSRTNNGIGFPLKSHQTFILDIDFEGDSRQKKDNMDPRFWSSPPPTHTKPPGQVCGERSLTTSTCRQGPLPGLPPHKVGVVVSHLMLKTCRLVWFRIGGGTWLLPLLSLPGRLHALIRVWCRFLFPLFAWGTPLKI